MTSYNKPKYVGKSIEGILNQSFEDFELFIMDDNSNEETQKVIEGYLKDQRIKYFCSNVKNIYERAKKIRYAVLINKALSMSKGEYISYATDDNVYRPQRLEKMVNYLECHPEINILYSGSRVVVVDKNGNEKKNQRYRVAKSKICFAPCKVDHCSIMHRADILPIIYKKWGSYWDEDPQYYFIGDARFFWRLNHFWCFYPFNEVLDNNYMTDISLHVQKNSNKKNPLMAILPKQKTCRSLLEDLKKIRGDM